MKGLKYFIRDWRHILANKHARIGIIVLLFIPLLYAGMFLAGYWDPYGRLDQLPVAVVNMDQGAELDGKQLHVGQDLTDHLKTNRNLDFQFVTKTEAEQGLRDGRFYISVLIPETFSQKVTTLMDDRPQTAELVYQTNQGNNFIAGQIGASAVEKLRDEVGDEITKSYTETVFANLQKLADGYVDASDGATKLSDGTLAAQNGFDRLQQGINHLAEGTTQLTAGIGPLTTGEAQLRQSLAKIQDGSLALTKGLELLSVAEQKIEQGATKLEQSTPQIQAGMGSEGKLLSQAAEQSQSVTSGLQNYLKDHPELANDPALQAVVQNATQASQDVQTAQGVNQKLTEGLQSLHEGQVQFAGGLKQFGERLSTAQTSGGKLTAGIQQEQDGMTKWETGFQSFTSGVTQVADGSQQLQTGSVPLANGLLQLVDGSATLSQGLTDAAHETAGLHTSTSMLDMFSRPVQVIENHLNPVDNYGTAMTPYFLTLGLFVGGLIASNIIPFTRQATQEGTTGWTHFVNKFSLFLSIGSLQTIIVDAVLIFGFQIDPLSVPKFLLLSLIASFTYLTFILMLVTLFGPLGRLVAIFFLVAQLASSGGTFPMVLAPSIVQVLGKCLPMTYAVRGFRDVISTGDWTQYWLSIGILLSYIAVFVLIALFRILKGNVKTHTLQGAR